MAVGWFNYENTVTEGTSLRLIKAVRRIVQFDFKHLYKNYLLSGLLGAK